MDGPNPKEDLPPGPTIYRRFGRRIIKILIVVSIFYLIIIFLFTYTRTIIHRYPHHHPPFPPTHQTDLKTHDPSILKTARGYYSYSVGKHISIHEAPTLSGPWLKTGTVLARDSIIAKGDRRAPWAPMTLQVGAMYYCYYAKLPKAGKEYQIRVGRSRSPQGPFVDKQGIDLVEGGGEVVYGSNGDVYAPGGQGVLTDEGEDILYYHYLNKSVSYDFWEARLGYNPLIYVDGWPVAQ
ncbi:hypothetical protein FE257_003729 [Aspergillus nanangensis]|uniref:Arabinan endo-1,5-alpha-L-arabinosidase n=1 Tax=Aspergillus nanangensis TaxID=2582783 RepID=A0AAD4GWB9_ASPNN|nr:hypothetical protein FE257_003729 [Aspergillus nanangensis]